MSIRIKLVLNGSVRWMRSAENVYFDAQENPDEIHGLQIDIAAQKHLQEGTIWLQSIPLQGQG